jgi:WD40 repeat protein
MFYPLSASSTTTTAAAPQKKSFSAYKDQLSIKTVAWCVPLELLSLACYESVDGERRKKADRIALPSHRSPDTQYIAVGSYDQTVRLINSRTWKVEMECKHTPAATRSKETVLAWATPPPPSWTYSAEGSSPCDPPDRLQGDR